MHISLLISLLGSFVTPFVRFISFSNDWLHFKSQRTKPWDSKWSIALENFAGRRHIAKHNFRERAYGSELGRIGHNYSNCLNSGDVGHEDIFYNGNLQLSDGPLNNYWPEASIRNFPVTSSWLSALNHLSLKNSPKINIQPMAEPIHNRHKHFNGTVRPSNPLRESFE